jgi:hypothetical protein
MQKWEYIYAVINSSDVLIVINGRSVETKPLINFLRETGNEGWELISVTRDDYGSRTFFFKRPKS